MPITVQEEKLMVLWIIKYQSRRIEDDSVGLINNFLYSHKQAISNLSSILEIFHDLRLNARGYQRELSCSNLTCFSEIVNK
jgi:hypothetical protein